MGNRIFLAVLLASLVAGCAQTSIHNIVSRLDPHGIEQVWVPAGSYLRGTANIESIDAPDWVMRIMSSEQPQHRVTLSRGFWIDKYELSNAAFARFVEAAGYDDPAYWSAAGWQWLQATRKEKDLPADCVDPVPDNPRVCVTWFEAEAYGNWRGARLPTEAEWEFAARGPDSLIYPWGNDFKPENANLIDSTGLERIDSYPAGQSWVGAHNMSGNAMEWVQDWLDLDYYSLRESVDPQGPAAGQIKIEKGGWWGSNSAVARSAYHHFEDPPSYQDPHIGFRLVSDTPIP